MDNTPHPLIQPDIDHGMRRDPSDVWPDAQPVGTFDIDPVHNIAGYPGATHHILFVCPNGRRCGVLLGPGHVDRPRPDALCIWKWDGNLEQPTITPSINCLAERDGKPAGGCGWHGFITAGEFR